MRKYPDAPPRLDPVEDMGIEDPTLFEATAKIEKLEAQLATNPGKNTCALVCVCVLYVSVCVCVCVCPKANAFLLWSDLACLACKQAVPKV